MPIPTDTELQELAEQLALVLLAQQRLIATAESCTGGWIGKICTDLPGSSAWYAGGVISYTMLAKTELLGVASSLQRKAGVVSSDVAAAMARGAVLALDSDFGIAVTGIAGPEGAVMPDQPVGTVWIGWASIDRASTERFLFSGTREDVRRQAVAAAIQGLHARWRSLLQEP